MIDRLYQFLIGLPPGLVLLIVFLVPAAEASMFLGFFFPGEVAIILGGVLANEHRLSLLAVIIAGSLGSIVGDSIGYEVGHRYGPRLISRIPKRLVKPESIEKGKELLRKKGGRAVFIGRFTVALRVLIPGLAGASGLPYRRFLLFNVLGGVAWATETAIFGYLAGRGYQIVAHRITQASIVLLAILVLAMLVNAIRRRQRAQAPAKVSGPAPAGDRVGQWAWWARRFEKHSQTGLGLTLSVAAVITFGWIFGGFVEDVVEQNGSFLYDPTTLASFVAHRTPTLTAAAKFFNVFGSFIFMYGLIALIGYLVWRRTGRLQALVYTASGLATAQVVAFLVLRLVGRARPPENLWLVHAVGPSFPSLFAVTATIGYGLLAYLAYRLTMRFWLRLGALALAAILIFCVGTSRIYLGVSWPSDVYSAWSFGAMWLAIMLGATYVWRFGSRSR